MLANIGQNHNEYSTFIKFLLFSSVNLAFSQECNRTTNYMTIISYRFGYLQSFKFTKQDRDYSCL